MEKPIIHLDKNIETIIKDNLPNTQVFSNLAYFYSIFSDTTRLKIMVALLLSEMCVNDLSRLLNLNQTTVSHQLKYLKSTGALTFTRKNKYIFYKINNNFINSIMLSGVDFIINSKKVG